MSNLRTQLCWLMGIGLFALSGCGGEAAPPPAAKKPASVFDYAQTAPTTPPEGTAATPAPAAVPQPAAPSAPVETERVEAQGGVGKKGRGYGGGIITEPVHQYFLIKDRIAFEIEIPHAMDLYKATNDFKAPASHEAFMRDIIEANQIKLPELPEGHKYVYDPKTAQLMVERPAGGNQTGE